MQPSREPRIVGRNRAAAGEDGVVLFTKEEAALARVVRRDPLALTRDRCEFAVERHAGFEQNERKVLRSGPHELLVLSSRVEFANANRDVDAGLAQLRCAAAVDLVIRIEGG